MRTQNGWPTDIAQNHWVYQERQRLLRMKGGEAFLQSEVFQSWAQALVKRHHKIMRQLLDPSMDPDRTTFLRGYSLAIREILGLTRSLPEEIEMLDAALPVGSKKEEEDFLPEFIPRNPLGRK